MVGQLAVQQNRWQLGLGNDPFICDNTDFSSRYLAFKKLKEKLYNFITETSLKFGWKTVEWEGEVKQTIITEAAPL